MKRKNVRRGGLLVKCCLFLLAAFLTRAGAANNFFPGNAYSVTNLNDGGPGSLREGIATAQTGDTIFFAVRGTIALTNGELLISNNLRIAGPGATNLAISANGQSRVMEILSNAAVELSGVTICDGRASDGAAGTSNSPAGGDGSDGGGIYNAGFLTLSQCVVSNCVAGNGGAGYQPLFPQNIATPDATNWIGGPGGGGGGVYNSGWLRMMDCCLSSNSSGAGQDGLGDQLYGASGNSGGGGGAIYNAGAMVLTSSVFEYNATGHGGVGYAFPDYFVEAAGGLHGGAGGDGGAVCDSGQTTTFVDDCLFISNTSGPGGIGAIILNELTGAQSGSVGGTGGSGGAVWVGGSMSIDNCRFLSNQTGAGGAGALGWTNGGGGGAGGSGGAICSRGQLSLTDCLCVLNQVGQGGAGGLSSGPGGAGGEGGAGGAICAMGALNLTRCYCNSNYAGTGGSGGNSYNNAAGSGGAGGGGGAIYAANALRLAVCAFNGNSAGGGATGGNGGALFCLSGLEAINCTFNENSAGQAGGQGGGIFGAGPLVLQACTVSENVGGNGSSGSSAFGAAEEPLTVPPFQDSVDANSHPDIINYFILGGPGGAGGAGGIYSQNSLNMVLCTVSGNVGGAGGGGGASAGGFTTLGGIEPLRGGSGGAGGPGAVYCVSNNELALIACTIAGNQGGSGGAGGSGSFEPPFGYGGQGPGGTIGFGGIVNASPAASASLINTIVAANFGGVGGGSSGSTSAPDLQGTFISLGYNLIGDADGSSGFTNGVNNDLAGSTSAPIDPVLGPLADNGGPTFTMALLHGSPALNAGDDALLQPPYSLRTDQRGFPRKSGPHVDIGAFEYQYRGPEAHAPGHDLMISGAVVANGDLPSNANSISSGSDAPVATGCFQLTFSDDTPGATFSVIASTNLSLPVTDWSIVGQPVAISPGLYQFTDLDSTNNPQRFYRVTSP